MTSKNFKDTITRVLFIKVVLFVFLIVKATTIWFRIGRSLSGKYEGTTAWILFVKSSTTVIYFKEQYIFFLIGAI
jgi:hypothetical protein